MQRPCGVNAGQVVVTLHFNLTSHASFVLLASPLRLVRLWSRSRRITVHAVTQWPLSEHWLMRIGQPIASRKGIV